MTPQKLGSEHKERQAGRQTDTQQRAQDSSEITKMPGRSNSPRFMSRFKRLLEQKVRGMTLPAREEQQ